MPNFIAQSWIPPKTTAKNNWIHLVFLSNLCAESTSENSEAINPFWDDPLETALSIKSTNKIRKHPGPPLLKFIAEQL